MKHFLDTSVARPLLLSSSAYRAHLDSELSGNGRYISPYVEMEFMRGFVLPVMNFCATLEMASIGSFDDAIALWSNRYQIREIKSVLVFLAQVVGSQDLDGADPADKSRIIAILASVVRRTVLNFRKQFTNNGTDPTRCSRAKLKFEIGTEDPDTDMREFAAAFDDKKQRRAKCSVDKFVLSRYVRQRDAISKYLNQLPDLKRNDQYKKVAGTFATMVEKGPDSITCDQCSKIGDAIIAISFPSTMRFEDTDASFDHFCDALNKPHKKHISEVALHKTAKAP